jgi:hypothetical protein
MGAFVLSSLEMEKLAGFSSFFSLEEFNSCFGFRLSEEFGLHGCLILCQPNMIYQFFFIRWVVVFQAPNNFICF